MNLRIDGLERFVKVKFALVTLVFLTLGLMLSASAYAQEPYPNKVIRVIVPFPAGGINDIVARLVLQKLGDSMRTAIVIDNRAGAGGTLGTALAAKSAPDGYTLLLGAASTIAVAPSIYRNPGYAPAKDFVAVGGIASVASVMLTSKVDKYKRLQDMVAAAQSAPGRLTFGSAGAGSSQHIQMELLKNSLRIDLLHVPYKGGAPAISDLLGGQIDFLLEPVPTALPLLTSGKLSALAVSSNERRAVLTNVPTFEEAGVPNFVVTTWFGLFAPAETPAAVVSRLDSALNKVLQDLTLASSMKDRGIDPMPMSSKELTKFAAEEAARWRVVVKKAGVTID